MHAAPPLRVGLARSRGWIFFVCAVSGLGAANVVAWALLHAQPSPWVAWLAALIPPAASAWAGYASWRAQPPCVLRWDGATWLCDDVPGDVQVVLDLDSFMLLRFVPGQRGLARRWLAATRRASDGPWHALRSALYSRRPAAVPDAPSL